MEDSSSKNAVIEMMAKRDRERKLVIEKNQRARQEKSELEGVDYFEATFITKSSELENRIINLESNSDIQNEFTSILNEVKDLQNYFTSSTIFLSDHKIKTCQNTINQLLLKCDEKKAVAMPKKKFGFKNKASKGDNKDKKSGAVASDADELVISSNRNLQWTDSKKSGVILRYEGEKVNDKDLTFEEMENCVVFIKGHAGSLQMSKMKNCLVICGPVARSIFADNCENSTFSITCQQLRLHSSTKCDIYIHVTSRAIIEDCKEINFAPGVYPYENYNDDMDAAGLDKNVNNWSNVGDFNWLSSDLPSPFWSQIEENKRISAWDDFINEFINKHNLISL